MQELLVKQQSLFAAAAQPSVAAMGQQLRPTQQQGQYTLQQLAGVSITAAPDHPNLQDNQQQRRQQQLLTSVAAQLPAQDRSWAGQLQQRPMHPPGHLMKLVQLLQDCSSLPQLQSIVDVHLQRMPPLALTLAMQQLQHIKRYQRALTQQVHQQQQEMFSSQQHERRLAEQLSRALLAHRPHLSAQTLTAFLSAAAAGRMTLPPVVLEQMASELVHGALRAACQERQQGQHQQQQHHHQQVQRQQQQQQAEKASTPLQQQPSNSLQHQCFSWETADPGRVVMQQQQPPHDVAAAAWALAKLQLSSPSVWDELCSLAGEQLHQFSPRDCVLLSWALAKQHHLQPRLFHAVQQQLSQSLHQLSPDSIAQLLWCCARLSHHHPGWVSALVLTATRNMERFSPRALSIMLWACAKLRHYEPHLLSAVRVQALASMGAFEPQCLSMFAWALARLGVRDDKLLEAVVQRSVQLVGGFTLQGLANVAWAATRMTQQMAASSAATAAGSSLHSSSPASRTIPSPGPGPGPGPGHPQETSHKQHQHRGQGKQQQQQQRHAAQQRHQLLVELLQRCCDSAVPVLQSSTQPQEVCNLLWACATARLRHPTFLDAAAQRLAHSASRLSAVDLAQALWALEVLGHRRRAQQQCLVQAGLNSLHLFGAQALSNWCWAIAASGMATPGGLPSAVARQVEVLLPEFSPQGLATTLWALSKMGHAAPQLLHAACPVILAGISSYNAQDICNVAMACCKAHHREPLLVGGLAQAAAAAAASTLAAYSRVGTSSATFPPPALTSPVEGSSWVPGPAAAPPAAAAGLSRLAMRQLPPPLLLLPSGRVAAPGGPSSAAHAALWRAQQAKQLTRQGVCNLVWAFSGLGWCDEALLGQLQQLAALSIQRGKLKKAQHVAGLLQGFARLSQPLPLLLDAMLEGSGGRQRGASSSSSSKIGSKIGSNKYCDKPITNISMPGDQRSMEGWPYALSEVQAWDRVLLHWPADALALLVWAAAATGAQQTHASCMAVAVQLLQQHDVSSLSPQRCGQLHLALLLLATEWGFVAWAYEPPHQEQQFIHSHSTSWREGAPATGSSNSRVCSSPAGDRLNSCSRDRSTSSAPQPEQHNSLQHAVMGLLQQLSLRCGPSGGQLQAPSAAVTRAQEEVVNELRAMRLQPLVDHWLSPVAPAAAAVGPVVPPATASATGAAEAVLAVDAAASGPTAQLEARLCLSCSSQQWHDDLVDSLHVRLGVAARSLGAAARRPVALELLPPASLTSSWPRRVLGATGLHHDCLRAAGWEVVLLPLEDWETTMQTGHQQQLLQHLLRL
jgi:hypothetical protein